MGQSRIDNPETQATLTNLDTRYRTKTNKIENASQKTKKGPHLKIGDEQQKFNTDKYRFYIMAFTRLSGFNMFKYVVFFALSAFIQRKFNSGESF